MHEVFLQRFASHPSLRNDVNFKVFLEYDQDVRETSSYYFIQFVNLRVTVAAFQLSVRGKNKQERLTGFFRNMRQSADEIVVSNQKDSDEYFQQQRQFIVAYYPLIKTATEKSDKMTKSQKSAFSTFIQDAPLYTASDTNLLNSLLCFRRSG